MVRVCRNRNVDVDVTIDVNSIRRHNFVMTPTSHMDLITGLFSKEPTTKRIECTRKSTSSTTEVFSSTTTTADVITTVIDLLNGVFGPSGFGEGFVEVELLHVVFSFISCYMPIISNSLRFGNCISSVDGVIEHVSVKEP